jgi:hypothetical protein
MLEFDTLVVPLDANVQQALEAKAQEGWMLVPGTVPRAIYQICRPLQQQQPQDPQVAKKEGFGVLRIDESKMYFIDKDGNRVERH